MDFLSNLLISGNFAKMATGTSSAGAAGGTMALQMGMLILIVVIFYFFLMRPQKKKEKQEQFMRSNVQIGDEIRTIGGIVGIVVKKTEDTLVIETGGDKSKIRIMTWAVQENLTAHEAVQTPSKEKKSKEDKKAEKDEFLDKADEKQ